MNILELAILKKMVGGGGGSGTDNYNDLSNLPKINDTTLSGNKTAASLGLQNEINSDNKLSSDLVDDTGATNLFVTEEEKLEWSGKQDEITNANKLDADLVDDEESTNKFVTAQEKETWNAKQNEIDSSHKLSSDLVDDTNHTNKFVTSQEKETWNGKQNAIDSDHKLSSSLVSFTTAEAAALASGIDSTKVGQISTNQTNILSVLNRTGKNIVNIQAPTSTRGCTFVEGDNGAVTITNTENWSQFIIENVHVKTNTQYKLVFYTDAISNLPAFNVYLRDHDKDGSALVEGFAVSNTGTIVKDFTSISDVISLNIYPHNQTTTVSGTATIRVMICEKTLYDLSNEYTWGIPNYDLTRLEAEDRAALAEEIDGGAKNKLPIDLARIQRINTSGTWNNNVYTVNNVTITVNSNKTITLNGTSSGVFEFYLVDRTNGNFKLDTGNYKFNNSLTASTGGDWDIAVNRTVSGSGVRYGSDGGSGLEFTVTDASANTGVWVACNVSGTVFNNVTIKPMICTKAAFGVSKAFVPYRYDPYTTVVQNVANTTLYAKRNGRTVTVNGYVDNVSFTPATIVLLGTINDEIGKPLQPVRTICSVGPNAWTYNESAYLTIAVDGTVNVKTNTYSGTGSVFFSVSYTF